MRTLICMLACGLALAPAARADDAVKALLESAAKAQGGADKAAKAGDLTFKGKGKFTEGDKTIEMSMDVSVRQMDRARMELTANPDGQTKMATVVVSGDNVWARDADRNETRDVPQEIAPLIRTFFLAMRAASAPASLAAAKDLTLAHGGEANVGEAQAAVLRVSRTGQPDVTVYFDKKSGLPLKSEAQMRGPGEANEVPYAFHFSDYKDTDGVKHYGRVKVTRDGKDMFEVELTDLKVGAKLDANTFEKP